MKKKSIEKLFRATTFFAIFFATTFFLNISLSSSGNSSDDIKSEDETFKDFSILKLDVKSENPLFFETKDRLSLNSGKKEDSFTSKEYSTPYKFNALGAHWREERPEGTSIDIEVRLKNSGVWGEWQKTILADTDAGKEASGGERFADLIFGENAEAFQYRVTLKTDALSNPPTLKDISFNYIDSTTKNSSEKNGLIKEAKASSNVISRASWGCPEAYGSPGWGPEYEGVTHAIIHHTAGGWNTSDPASSVRAIWSYHTYTKGWGDIGYNYLIDGYGNIYEGRYGGEDVVAGHAFPYNRATIGISVMGNYSNGDISGSARGSLTELMAWKFGSRNINPLSGATLYAKYTVGGGSTTDVWGRNSVYTTRIVGHRDVASTACPGNVFYSTLDTIRVMTSQKWPQYAYPWQLISYEAFTDKTLSVPTAVPLYPGETITIKIVIKNTSSRTWSNSGPNPTRLGTSNPRDRASAFAAQNWIAPHRPVAIQEAEVAPGGNATFIFDVQAPAQGGNHKEYFTPLIEGVSWMNDIGMFIYLGVISDFRWQLTDQKAYTDGTLQTVMDPGNAQPNDEFFLLLKARNVGQSIWYNSGKYPVRLGTSNPQDRASAFATQDWIAPHRPTNLSESKVSPGEIGTFVFPVKSSNVGTYNEYFNLLAEGVSWMNDPGLYYHIVINNPYSWQYISSSSDKSLEGLSPGDTAILTLTAKNTGTATWYNNGPNPVRVGTSNPQDRMSAFKDDSWLTSSRPATLTEASVAPGETGTFSWTIKTPYGNGEYREYFNLLAEGVSWMNDPGAYYPIAINGIYSWQYITHSSDKSLEGLSPGDTATLTLTAKNTGTATWHRTGSYPVRIGTSHPIDRQSSFADGTWIAPHRPVGMPQGIDIVAPGEQVTFSWIIKTPNLPGAYNREYFNLLAEGITWMNDPGAFYFIEVIGSYNWQYVSHWSSRGLEGLFPGDTAILALTAKNTGTATWFRNGSYPVRVGTSNPQDRQSSFADASWIAPHRPVGMPQGIDIVAPGEQITFSWTIKTPNLPGAYNNEYFNLLSEGRTWMNDLGAYYYVVICGSTILEGIPLPAYSGKTASEQHLALSGPQESAPTHYAISGTPAPAQNGMAWETSGGSGFGAWGTAPPIDYERYYIAMRWNYTNLHGQPIYAPKNWYYKKKVLIVNPANSKKVVASVIEYGPAPWTGRVSGLSPEAMLALSAVTNTNLQYFWASDQNMSLGPIL